MSIEIPLSIKYRPKKLADVIGQPVIVQALTNAFKSNSLHHAYILEGKYGCGKTSVGRIIAAMENCDKGPTLEPCCKCDNCKEIFNGKSFDVREIDAASHRGVDDIRSIHKDIYTSPIQCRVKYVIIDEAHSLTGIAAEAALKMLEEPPEGVRFVLATTEAHRFKETILSRCIPWKFNKVSWSELHSHLKNIAGQEEIEYEEEALITIAKSSKGSVRNSLQNLQTVINYVGDNKITDIAAIESLGQVDQQLYFNLIDSIINAKPSQSYIIVNNIFKSGKEAGSIVNDIYSHLNGLLLAKTCGGSLSEFGFTEEEVKKYTYQAKNIQGDMVLKIVSLLKDVSLGLKFNLDPDFLFNTFFIECIISYKKMKNKESKK
jgi:DNA polymerase III subunit gamma/tau